MISKKTVLIKSLDGSCLGDWVDRKAAQVCPGRPTEDGHMNRKQQNAMQYGKQEANT